ncbi:uncharacterized protein PITG_10323 [Phytophthora infestans T30-4]|uniref:Uncharacterized protein n=1 Tax=Phytophthora infestans (strain T30-4) TaxID=403677 RepID=D0NF21_PHYIT|nr:uncharacterized protein PITG_10323 [Phytophthora infestans T30-4]EEY56810.1 hypothetical protein PITG_10323 [Phytophthora infestans T30-4]|eukprot:XP_002902138.1 hypothetical protein PITG_10323 [Phytophthora infestans T30-4]
MSSPVWLLRINGFSHIQMPVVLRLRPALQLNPFSPYVSSMFELPSSFPSPLPVTPSMTQAFQTSVLSFCPCGRRPRLRKWLLSCPRAPGGRCHAALPRRA